MVFSLPKASVGGPGETAPGSRQLSRRRRLLLIVGFALIAACAWPAWKQGETFYYTAAAQKKIAQGEFARAVEILQRLETSRPGQAQTAYLMAVALRRGGDFEAVPSHLRRAESRGWSAADVRRQELLLQAQTGHLDRVETQLRNLFQEDLDDEAALEVYEALAKGYWINRRMDDLLECLDFWLQWRPNDLAPRLMRAEAYVLGDNPESAAEEYRRIVGIDPDHLHARVRLGSLLLELGKIEDAHSQFQYCFDKGGLAPEMFRGLAECEHRLGRTDAAEQWLARIDAAGLGAEEHAKVLKLKADLARFRRDLPAARQLLIEAIELWPHNRDTYDALGQVHAALGDEFAAQQCVKRGQEIGRRAARFHELELKVIADPENAQLRFELGQVLFEQGFHDDAAVWWLSAATCNPEHQPTQEALARYYAEHGDPARAAVHRRSAESAARQTFRTAWSSLQSGDLATAKQLAPLVRKYESLAPQSALLQASLLCKEGRHAEAFRLAAPALSDSALRPLALIVIGEALVGQKQIMAAEPLFQEVLRANPNSVDAHRWLSVLYYDLGAIDQASFHLQKVAELDAADYRPHRLLGLINKDYEVYDAAVEHYRESLRRFPQQPPREEVLLELAECLVQLRDYDAALKTLDEATPSGDSRALKAECLFSQGRTEDAVVMAREVLQEDPHHLRALLVCGDAALARRAPDEALEYFKNAVSHHPYDYTANHKLGQAFAQAGLSAEAQDQMAKAHELKELRLRFAKLHEEAFARPRDAAPRRELAEIAERIGRPDLAQVWKEAADAIEDR